MHNYLDSHNLSGHSYRFIREIILETFVPIYFHLAFLRVSSIKEAPEKLY